jgi:hypothetical protein
MPWNSIEGGLFLQEKLGRSRYPKYMIGPATHMYNPNSDTSGGWGFAESTIGCEYLGRVQLSNRVLVPPSHIAFDETQSETNAENGGNYFGVGWNALPIFGGTERTDSVGVADDEQKLEPDFAKEAGRLSWTLTVDFEQVYYALSHTLLSLTPLIHFSHVHHFSYA